MSVDSCSWPEKRRFGPKVLTVIPWLSITVLGCALFMAWDRGIHENFFRQCPSHYGRTIQPGHFLWSIGWTLFCTLVLVGVTIKAHLWNQTQKITYSSLLWLNLFLVPIGILLLLIMAWSPNDTAQLLHEIGVYGSVAIWLAMIVDTFQWYFLLKEMNFATAFVTALTAYSILLNVATLSMMACWQAYKVILAGDPHEFLTTCPFEWSAVCLLLLQYLNQSVHGLMFYLLPNALKSTTDSVNTPLLGKSVEGMTVVTFN